MHHNQFISDVGFLSLLDNIDENVDILCQGYANADMKLDYFQEQFLMNFLNNNKLGGQLRQSIYGRFQTRGYLTDVGCPNGVIVLSRKAVKAALSKLWDINYKL